MSFPRYPSYKPSGVEWLGEVPAHWRLGSVRRFVRRIEQGWSPECLAYPAADGEWGVLKAGCVNGGEFDPTENKALPGTLEPIPDYEVRSGDLLVSRASGSPDFVGASAYIRATPPRLMLSDKVFRLSPERGVSGAYLARLLSSRPMRAQIERAISGAEGLANNLPQGALKAFLCGIPPIEEQDAIVAFLDRETAKIDALIAEQERLLELLKEKRQAVIAHAVTKGLNPDAPMKPSGIEWLGDVPAHWAVAPLGSRFSVQLGKMLDSAKQTGLHARHYLRVFDVQWGQINIDDLPQMDFSEGDRRKFQLVPGDLLVNEGGSYPGRCALWLADFECYYQKALHRLRPQVGRPDRTHFLYYVLLWAAHKGVFVSGGNEATIEHLPAEKLRRYRFAFPDPNEQGTIAAFLDEMTRETDALIRDASQAAMVLNERRASLVSAAVTGQIDVRGLN